MRNSPTTVVHTSAASLAVNQFFERGWTRIAFDEPLADWVGGALPAARATLNDPDQSRWMRYQQTWFAGVNALANDASGAVGGSGPLRGAAVDFIANELGFDAIHWDQAQVSICYPGYPRAMPGESAARLRYRVERDAAHVDGLHPVGDSRRRFLREQHAFILGIPMVEFSADAAPFVVYEGSQEIMRRRLGASLQSASDPAEVDLTEVYQAARTEAFAACQRVEVHAIPGEAILAHRLLLHGMAPWRSSARAGPDGRMICYFRPAPLDVPDWISLP